MYLETSERNIIAMIGEPELVTGMLLTGIGCVDRQGNRNYLSVDESLLQIQLCLSFFYVL